MIISLFGLGSILILACIFWRPLRARTFGVFGFAAEAVRPAELWRESLPKNTDAADTAARESAIELFYLRVWNVLGYWALAAAVLGIGVWLGRDIWNDTFVNAEGEPFSLTNGISGWPAIILRTAAVILSVSFCCTLYSQMRVTYYELTRRYRFTLGDLAMTGRFRNRIAEFFRRPWEHCCPFRQPGVSPSGAVAADELWSRYYLGGYFPARALRVLVPCLAYFVLAGAIYQLFAAPSQPLRGYPNSASAQWADFRFLGHYVRGYVIVNVTFFFLTFLTIDAAYLCCQFIRNLGGDSVEFSEVTRAHFQRQWGNVSPELLDDWIGTQLIADLTERVGKLLWFPGIVFLLLLLARVQWWDNWTWHPAHLIIMALNFLIAGAGVFILQRAARAAKNAAEERLSAKVRTLGFQTASSPTQNDAGQAKELLEAVQTIHRGAFVSIWENPVLGALMVGPGGLTVFQMIIWLLNH